MTSASHSTADQADARRSGHCRARPCNGSNWSAFNIAAMVIGFVIYWPVGLFVLCWISMGRDVQDLPGTIRDLWSKVSGSFGGEHGPRVQGAADNTVFNEFQQAQYERVREIKDEIKSRARRFGEFRAKARRRADEEEFNEFMSDAPPVREER